MKKIVNKTVLSLIFLAFTFSGCVQDDDFDTPEITFEEPNLTVTNSIQDIKDIYLATDEDPTDFELPPPVLITDSLIIEGYVISSDKTGNFYKELIIQSSPENPEAGISIQTDASDLYTFFEPGRKVYVSLKGLYVGEDGGVITIGDLYGAEVGRMDNLEFEQHVFRSGETAEIVPTVITLDQVSDAKVNTLVTFENMQFPSGLVGEHYGNLDDTFTVNREVESCVTGQTIILRNSGFASFKNELLPEGQGSITAVLSKFNADYQLYIRDTEDINFDQPRCDALFEENFEEINITGPGEVIDLPEWTNVNVSGGEWKWDAREYSDNTYAQISAYNSNENPMHVWLITPGIDLSGLSNSATFRFDSKDGHNNGEGLKVYVSTDFSGDVTAATWTELNVDIATGSTNGYAAEFTPSGNVDLSSYDGQTVYFGFEYLGSDNGITTTYQIDNIEVSAN
ncbi:MAG TPA: DUF5689 domain-containing protein [Flavobacteriaceae bacterium]|nr:DUF5689 domain-containing protein [Flavobacteriaceae bacterium]